MHLWVAVADVGHVIDTVQVLVAIGVVEAAALAAHHVQRTLVYQRRVGADVLSPLGQHCVIVHVAPLRSSEPVSRFYIAP